MPQLEALLNLSLWAFVPFFAFWSLAALERFAPPQQAHPPATAADWAMNLAGLAMQGLVVPLAGFALAEHALAPAFGSVAGALAIGFWGAFALNLVGVDLLYYLQHRLFHARPFWGWHQAHHAAPRVSVWATSRNTVWTHFVFVYLLVNPWLAMLTDSPEGFFAGAMLTAALDLWRHARIDWARLGLGRFIDGVSWVLITPAAHHRHHADGAPPANFGANLSLWDRIFGTYAPATGFPARYAPPGAPAAVRQFLFPWFSRPPL